MFILSRTEKASDLGFILRSLLSEIGTGSSTVSEHFATIFLFSIPGSAVTLDAATTLLRTLGDLVKEVMR